MKLIEDKSLETARKKFIGSILLLVFAFIYLISPIDILPDIPPIGYTDDILLLLVSCIYCGFSYFRLKRERSKA